MKIKGWLLLALTAGLLIMVVPAMAQYDTPGNFFPIPEDYDLNYSLQVGNAFLVGNNVENDSRIIVGVSWFGPTGWRNCDMTALGISGDWIPVRRNDGTDVNLIPVMINYRKYGIMSPYRIFITLGAGILYTTDSITEMNLEKGSNFGWTGGIGIDLSNNLFGNFRFIGGKNPADDGIVSLQLGYRF